MVIVSTLCKVYESEELSKTLIRLFYADGYALRLLVQLIYREIRNTKTGESLFRVYVENLSLFNVNLSQFFPPPLEIFLNFKEIFLKWICHNFFLCEFVPIFFSRSFFFSDSMVTKMVRNYFKLIAFDYLHKTMTPILEKIIENPKGTYSCPISSQIRLRNRLFQSFRLWKHHRERCSTHRASPIHCRHYTKLHSRCSIVYK